MEEEKMEKKDSSSSRGEVVMVDEEEDVVFPGFRFHPTDEELVTFYLRHKVENKPLSIEIIKQIDIYKYDPWDLPKANHFGGEKEWYFFCLRGRKYRNSIRPNRVTGSGFWKATGIDRPICSSSGTGECIGLKKSLVYYRGSAGKGTKTDLMMHEFRLPPSGKDNDAPPSIQEAEIWTICRIFKRNISSSRKHQHDPKGSISKRNQVEHSNFESFAAASDVTVPHGTRELACDYYDEKNQPFPTHWTAATQTPWPAFSNASVPQNPAMVNDLILKDGNWDELGRIMELMTDSSTV